MQYAEEEGNYRGWSIEAIQEHKIGVEPKTTIFNQYLEEFLAAIKATNLLNDDTYNEIKNILLESEQWTADLKKLEEDIEHIALRLV